MMKTRALKKPVETNGRPKVSEQTTQNRPLLYRHARIPPLYWDAELATTPVIGAFADNLIPNLRGGIGMLMMGPNGVGKTYQSCALAKAALEYSSRVLYISAPDVVRAYIDDAMFDEDMTMASALRSRWLLIIDDLGQEYRGSGSGFSEQNIVNLIRFRITYRRSTIITTNLNEEQLQATYGEGFASLLRQGMVNVIMKGADRRKDPAARQLLLEKSGVKA